MSRSRRTLLAATVCNVVAVLPVFLLGALAVLIRRDLGFSETQLGAAVSVFFAVSAAGSTTGGWVSQRIGAHRAMAIVAVGSGVALLGVAALARSYAQLLAWLVLAGAANALCQPATNLALVGAIRPGRHGLALGIKQSAIPCATLIGGLAVPLIGLTVGWRWAFASAALVAVLFMVVAPRHAPAAEARGSGSPALESRLVGMVVLALAAGTGFLAVSALGAFYVESAVANGVAEGVAGAWFAVGGLVGMTGRVGWGWFADRRQRGHFPLVALLIVLGAVGLALLGLSTTVALRALATVLAFGAGWSWMGVFHLGVVRRNPAAPAVATGVIQTGAFVGGVIGPLGFGLLVEHVSHRAAWWAAAAVLVVAAALVVAGRHLTRPGLLPAGAGR